MQYDVGGWICPIYTFKIQNVFAMVNFHIYIYIYIYIFFFLSQCKCLFSPIIYLIFKVKFSLLHYLLQKAKKKQIFLFKNDHL
jgi:hypothetical protein